MFQGLGIEIGFLVSGLFGSILMVSKSSNGNLKSTILAILGGMASANYLTPIMVQFANVKDVKMQNGLAFIVGFLGLKLVEMVSEKFLEKIDPKPITTTRKTKTKKVTRK
jgi:uncharacterized membrane protein YeaQ/YmgE (transglycosylase-associated protein family)